MQLKIEKLVYGGKALARQDGKVYFVEGALPGEIVEVEIVKENKGFAEAKVLKLIESSTFRLEPREHHYESCSPWQILNFAKENEIKKEIIRETFQRFAKIELPEFTIVYDERDFNYRNKIEFSFLLIGEKLQYAVFKPNSNDLVPIHGCELADFHINRCAKQFLDFLDRLLVEKSIFKKVIFRTNLAGDILALLTVKSVKGLENIIMPDFLHGWQIFEDNGFNSEKVFSFGSEVLVEKIENTELVYGGGAFFQINVPVFFQAVKDIGDYLRPIDEVLDFYSGVGAISLPIAEKFKKAELIELNEEAVNFAKINIAKNKIKNCSVKKVSAESAIKLIDSKKVLLVDPPRQGLDEKITKEILKKVPPKIIYLSCDQATQARDFNLLKNFYEIKFFKLYNFFPHTPHVESLLVLYRKKEQNNN